MQAIALALGAAAAQALIAVPYILTARGMQPASYGIVATSIVLGVVGAGFLDLGSSQYWIRELASGRETLDDLMPRITTKFVIACVASVFVIIIAVLTDEHYVATGVILLSSISAIIMLVPLRAARRAELVGLLTALNRTFAVAAFFVLKAAGIGLGLALWISIAVGDLFLILYLTFSRISGRFRFTLPLSNPWTGAKWYSLNAFSSSTQQLDLPILSLLGGSAAAGIYGGVNRWTQPLTLATTSFAAAAAPFLAAQSSLREARSQLVRASWIIAMVIAVSIGVILTAPTIVTSLLGDAYIDSVAILQWLAAAVILNALAQPLLVALMSRLFDHLASIILTAAVVTQLVLVATLAPMFGALSAGIGVFASQLLQFVGSAFFVAAIIWKRRRSPV